MNKVFSVPVDPNSTSLYRLAPDSPTHPNVWLPALQDTRLAFWPPAPLAAGWVPVH